MNFDKTGLTVCRMCKKEKEKYRAEKFSDGRGYKYRGSCGKEWDGKKCPDCARISCTIYDRKSGRHLPRSEVTSHRYKLGFISEKMVKDFFESDGFSVSQTNGAGPDLTIFIGTMKLTCEVKTIFKSGTRMYVPKISKKRMNDDLIAMVFPNGEFKLETMADHLHKCSPAGYRRIV